MKIEIIAIDKQLSRMDFHVGDKCDVIKMTNKKYPVVINPQGNETMLLPKDYNIIIP